MSTLRFVRATLRRARDLDLCGHTSTGTAPAAIADWTQARATMRIRLAVFAAICEPSSFSASLRSMSAMRSRSSSPSVRQFLASHRSSATSRWVSAPGARAVYRWTRNPSGGLTPARTAMVVNRERASTAEVRVRGCHSAHCSVSQRRAHSCTPRSPSGVCQASGSPLDSSKRLPSCTACNRRPR